MMQKAMHKVVLAGVSAAVLAACTQQPAPVVSGYDAQGVKVADYAPYKLKAMRQPAAETSKPLAMASRGPVAPAMQEEDLARIEPAAGPVVEDNGPRAVFAPLEVTGGGTYTVGERDTLYKIARAHNVTARELMAENGLESTAEVRPGMVLRIPSHAATFVADAKPQASSVNAVERAEAALAKLEGKREEDAPRVASVDEAKLEADAAAIEPAAGTMPKTSLATPAPGEPRMVAHKVAAGETVYRISKQYNASVIDIMAANEFVVPQDLKAGMVVKVPVGSGASAETVAMESDSPETAAATAETKTTQVTAVAASPEDAAKLAAAAELAAAKAAQAEEARVTLMQKGRIDPLAAKSKGLAWPVKGKIIKKYGEQGQGVAHTGINIAVPVNTPVLAADDGSVLYAGNGLKTYGNLVLIRHSDGMVTAYGHNGKLLVGKGEKVKKGQVVALSGRSGNVEEPQVHFEIRKQAKAVDPLRVLASR